MRQSRLLLPTERQPPADAEALSHQLMVRAGLVRQVGAGLWTWLPAGWRVHQRVVQVVREEMDAIGGQEMLAPVLQPAELWKRSGRYEDVGAELFRLQDRKDADLVLGLSGEETYTFHVASLVKSWRDLPKVLYHFQVKERDEPRPRAGVLRTREFIMKDSYSFDRDAEGLAAAYEQHRQAYHRMLQRCGLEYYEVASDVGVMGGSGAHEFMAPCPAGENEVALAPGYAANVEVASADAQPVPALTLEDGTHETPGARTIDAVAGQLGVAPGNLVKAYPVVVEGRGYVLVLLRGDHQVEAIKLTNALGAPFRPATEDELHGPAGFLGPKDGVDTLIDAAVTPGRYVAGANEPDRHAVVTIDDGPRADVRKVVAGDTVNGAAITVEPAIEVGNIFSLDLRYSEPLSATYLDAEGKEQHVWMGSYGIGPARIAAAAVEQHADDRGIAWPKSIAPWDVHVVALGKPNGPEQAAAQGLYDELNALGHTVLLDDRDAGTGAKLTDAELLGCPLRLVIGKRGLQEGKAEAQIRRGQQPVEQGVSLAAAAEEVQRLWPDVP